MRRLHGIGLIDNRIAERMGTTSSRVRWYREREGLPINKDSTGPELMGPLLKKTRELHAKGLTDKQIAKVIEISRHRVAYCRFKMGLDAIQSEQKKNREKLKAEVKKLHVRKLTDEEIAAKLGKKVAHIRRIRYSLGLERNLTPEEKERDRNKRRVWDLYQSGLSYTEIAEELGIRYNQVSFYRLWMMSQPEGEVEKIGNE